MPNQTPFFYAHSVAGQPQPTAQWQLLRDHLKGVAKLAGELAQKTGVADLPAAAEAAGWLHDLGKYQLAWQAYLLASAAGLSPKSVRHSIHGAAYAFAELQHCPLTLAIAGHHTGLPDWQGGDQFEGKVNEAVPPGCLSELMKTASRPDECPAFPTTAAIPNCEDSDQGMRRLEYWTRILFSTLIDADRLDTAGRRISELRLDPGALLDRFRATPPKNSMNTSVTLNDLRNRVFEECIASGGSERGFFELTVPTGGGKTRSGMAFALSHARHRALRRVFVVIPYLSIIEQNAREYRNLFGKEVVLEHHSAVVFEDVVRQQGEPYRSRLPEELSTENWDVPIVVTTSVQFLETLLAAGTRRCRRLHNVARSVILFDEAQCLPTHILNPLLDVFRELVSNYGCSIVFSTATQPAFRYSPYGLTNGLMPEELRPILPKPLRDELYRDLQRVTFVDETAAPWDWDELVKRLIESPALCILNTRRHAREVWEKLRAAVKDNYGNAAVSRVRHLSSSLCAEHRMDILGRRDDIEPGTIYHQLQEFRAADEEKDRIPCWVVSTQVIEAGVDIDFPRVFRALGPLDSIVQAGGRCNREGTLKDSDGRLRQGEVFIFRPADEGMPAGAYQIAAGEALTTLGEITPDELVTNPEVFVKYFSTLFNRLSTDPRDIQKMRAEWKFESVAEAARVIDDSGRSAIVPYRKAKKWIRRLRQLGTYDLAILRRLQRYTVNLRPNDFAEACRLGLVTPLYEGKPDGPWILVEGCYHDDLGVVITGRPLEDFLV